MNREMKQTLIAAAAFFLAILGVGGALIVIGHNANKLQSKTIISAHMPPWMNDPNAPFVDLNPCIKGDGEPNGSHNVFIGKNINNATISAIQNCVVAIGDNVRIPPNASYYFNIGNHICGDLRTGQRLRCPRATDKVQNKTVGIGSEPHGSHEVLMGDGEGIVKNPNTDVNFPLFGFVKP